MTSLTRRDLLKSAAVGSLTMGWTFPRDPYAGFKMGMQTYSLRAFDLDGVLERMKELGLSYAQFYPSHQMAITADAETIKGYRTKLQEAKIKLLSFGVVGFGKDHDRNKATFEFAKAMGFTVIVADPAPDSFESLDALTQDYGMKIAIHNHGPGSRYDKLSDTQKAVEKYPEAIGACVDTGHVIRSGEDPVKVIDALGPRVHDVHLKDASGPSTYNILGEGKLRVRDTLKALKKLKFEGCLALEYELNHKNPMADMKRCLNAVKKAAKDL